MASIVLAGAATSLGGIIAGPVGAAIGGLLGQAAGSLIDNQIFGPTKLPDIYGPRLTDLSVQTSAYGRMIPIIYGTIRIAGNIIWARPIQEYASTTNSGGGKGGGPAVEQSQTTYSYTATLAIALGEGEITDIMRVWADAEPIDPRQGTYRLYKGTEDQLPDPLIESFQGVGSTPAYRGMAYVVIEDFPLANYGNRIPNFTFEVKRKALALDNGTESLEQLVQGVTMIPGSGEFVYDTELQSKITGLQVGDNFVQVGSKIRINQHNFTDKTDALVALDQLEETLPNVQWVSVVVTWFGDSMDAGECTILPRVEYTEGGITEPDLWQVGSFTRATTQPISLDAEGRPNYGGTVSDASIVRYLDELRDRGYSIMFYPMFFMDVEDKPWRGRVTGTPAEVADFFTKTDGYNAFIEHYANLVKGKVDAFIIGSELKALTSVQDVDDSFPAVDALVALAATVDTILDDPAVKITYAADWSEYHSVNGWFNLDPLWASPHIDMIGIDAYFPLTDELQPRGGFTLEQVKAGWTSGEGYEYYYTDAENRTGKTFFSDPTYAWKNIAYWWSHTHTNPDSSTTAWTPNSKKIWFTEYGFPSVDAATNQPNVFYDPNSIESHFPYYSQGRVDFPAQRLALTATEEQWRDSAMVEQMFIWTWDARPFPFWPDLRSVWSDGGLWITGHWINGKLGMSNLGAIIGDISVRAGMEASSFDVTRLTQLVDGFVLTNRMPARAAIELLQSAYFFDAVESDGVIKYVLRGGASAATIAEEKMIPGKNERLKITRVQELELPQRIDVNFINRATDYQAGNQHARRAVTETVHQATIALPVVMTNPQARNIADISLYNAWLGRMQYALALPIEYVLLEPTDVITLNVGEAVYVLRITGTHLSSPFIINVTGIAEEGATYDAISTEDDTDPATEAWQAPGTTQLLFLDLPAFSSEEKDSGMLRFAVRGLEDNWRGAVIYRSDDNGANYNLLTTITQAAIIGATLDALVDGPTAVFDETSEVTVALLGGELSGTSELAVLNGANVALIGEEIVQFKNAELIEPGKYRLSGLLRGRLGTESKTASHNAGETFVLLDNRLSKISMPNSLIGLPRLYKAVSIGSTLGATEAITFTYQGNALAAYAPVFIVGERDGGGNLAITWIRRTRIDGGWRDYVDAALGEAAEAYEVEILDGGDVVRTITGLSSATVSYSAAEQTTDFGSPQTSVTVRVYQLSTYRGRGEAGEGVV